MGTTTRNGCIPIFKLLPQKSDLGSVTLNCAASGQKINHEDDQRQYKQQVYESADGVAAHKTEQPQDQ